MRQVTLVAFYGLKPESFSSFSSESQYQITAELKDLFEPYEIQQIHATIVSLERSTDNIKLNRNFSTHRGRKEQMDLSGLLNFLRNGGRLPFNIQIGGFKNRDYPFTSRGTRPYERSFSIQGDKAVMMGWPISGEPSKQDSATSPSDLIQESRKYPLVLDDIRRSCQSFGILHGYHRDLTDIDNDFYFRIGLVSESLRPEAKEGIQRVMREFQSKQDPVILEVSLSNLFLASYEDETLPIASTQYWSISEKGVTPEFVSSLYG